jgi:hypothetical protein
MSDFNEYTIKGLKKMISTFRSHNIVIKNYSKLKKPELIALLNQHFSLKDGQIFKKILEPAPVKIKKRIAPVLISQAKPEPIKEPVPAMTQGQKRYMEKIKMIERKQKDMALYKKIKGIRV